MTTLGGLRDKARAGAVVANRQGWPGSKSLILSPVEPRRLTSGRASQTMGSVRALIRPGHDGCARQLPALDLPHSHRQEPGSRRSGAGVARLKTLGSRAESDLPNRKQRGAWLNGRDRSTDFS